MLADDGPATPPDSPGQGEAGPRSRLPQLGTPRQLTISAVTPINNRGRRTCARTSGHAAGRSTRGAGAAWAALVLGYWLSWTGVPAVAVTIPTPFPLCTQEGPGRCCSPSTSMANGSPSATLNTAAPPTTG